MIGVVAEATIKAVEVSTEVVKVTGKEVASKAVDIGKRVETGKKAAESVEKGVDISKRIPIDGLSVGKEIIGDDLKEVVKEYINDLKVKSECAETIADNCLDITKLEIQAPEKVAELREEFDDKKVKLRKEWEKLNGKEWPKYKEDIYNADGVRIRKAGDNYDAHHIQPLSLGGENLASNLTPLDLSKHSEIHSSNGSCTKLADKVERIAQI